MRPGAKWRAVLQPWLLGLPVAVQRALCSVAGREWSGDLSGTSVYALSLPAAYPRSVRPFGGAACDALAEVLALAGAGGFVELVGAAAVKAAGPGQADPVLRDWVCPPLPAPIQEEWAVLSWEVEQ